MGRYFGIHNEYKRINRVSIHLLRIYDRGAKGVQSCEEVYFLGGIGDKISPHQSNFTIDISAGDIFLFINKWESALLKQKKANRRRKRRRKKFQMNRPTLKYSPLNSMKPLPPFNPSTRKFLISSPRKGEPILEGSTRK